MARLPDLAAVAARTPQRSLRHESDRRCGFFVDPGAARVYKAPMRRRLRARLDRIGQTLGSDDLYELMIMVWIVTGPLAISRWVHGLPEPSAWAAFIAGVIGVLVGWLVVAPYQSRRD